MLLLLDHCQMHLISTEEREQNDNFIAVILKSNFYKVKYGAIIYCNLL